MKLLALVEEPDHVCCRYRIRAFEPALAAAGCSLTCEGLDRGAFFRSIQLHRAERIRRRDPAAKAAAELAIEGAAPGLAPAGVRLRRRGDVPRLVFASPRAQPLEGPAVRPDRPRGRHDRRRKRLPCGRGASSRGERRASACDSDLCRPPALSDRAAATGPLELVWIGSSSTLQGLEQSRPIWQRVAEAIPGLKLRVICDRFPESFPLPVDSGGLERADRGTRDCGGPDRHKLDSGRSLEPGKVRAQGVAVPGGGAAGGRQPGRSAPRDGARRRDGVSRNHARRSGRWPSAGWSPTCRCGEDGPTARRQVEANYSVSAWAETFVTSMTGTVTESLPRFLEDRSSGPTEGRKGFEPHLAGPDRSRTFNQIGDR